MKASFFYLKIYVKHRESETKIFAKRDLFPFFIVKMPYRDSNMPTGMFYAAFGFQVLRFLEQLFLKKSFRN